MVSVVSRWQTNSVGLSNRGDPPRPCGRQLLAEPVVQVEPVHPGQPGGRPFRGGGQRLARPTAGPHRPSRGE